MRQHGRPVLHDRRHLARLRHLLPHRRSPLNSQGEEYQLVTPGVAIRFGVPFSEYDTVFFGIGFERTEIKGDTALPNNYFLYREQFGATSSTRAADARLDARPARQRAGADRRPLPARQPRLGRARRRALPARQRCRYQQYIPLDQALHARPQRRDRLGQGPGRPAATRSSRTSTAAASARCAASTRARSARST